MTLLYSRHSEPERIEGEESSNSGYVILTLSVAKGKDLASALPLNPSHSRLLATT